MGTGPVIPVGPGPVDPGPVGPPVNPGPPVVIPPSAGPIATIPAAQPHNFTVDNAQFADNGGDPIVTVNGTVDGVAVSVTFPHSMVQGAAPAAVQQLVSHLLLEKARAFIAQVQAIKTPVEITLGAFTL